MRHILLFIAMAAVPALLIAQIQREPFEFHVRSGTEAFVGRATTVEVRFSFYFPVDEKRYLPVDAEMAKILSAPPEIETSGQFDARVIASECKPASLIVEQGDTVAMDMKGGEIVTTIELTPLDSAADRDVRVGVRYRLITAVFATIGASPPALPETSMSVHVWSSVAARDAFTRAEEEKFRKQRQEEARARRVEEERVRRENEAAAKARRAAWMRRLDESKPYATATLLLILIVLLYRHWLFPGVTVTLTRGGHVQHTLPHARVRDEGTEPGTIIETRWANSRFGRRKRIKVETLVSDAQSDDANGVDLLVSVGTSVRPGRYLAVSRKGAVKVVVTAA